MLLATIRMTGSISKIRIFLKIPTIPIFTFFRTTATIGANGPRELVIAALCPSTRENEMRTWKALWVDEVGSVLSAEAVALATIAVMGATIGMTTAVNAVDEEWADFARMMRSLDQSFSYPGLSYGNAQAAGSSFEDKVDDDVAGVSIRTLDADGLDIAGAAASSTSKSKQINELMNETDESVKSQAKPQSQPTIQNEECPTPSSLTPNALPNAVSTY